MLRRQDRGGYETAHARTKQTVRRGEHSNQHIQLDSGSSDEDQGERAENETVSQGAGENKSNEQEVGEDTGGAVGNITQ